MNKIFNGTTLVLIAGIVLDILIAWWVVKTFDVVPDRIEEKVINFLIK